MARSVLAMVLCTAMGCGAMRAQDTADQTAKGQNVSALTCSIYRSTDKGAEKAELRDDEKAQLRQLRMAAEDGPFYRQLISSYHKPMRCDAVAFGTRLTLAYRFAKKAEVETTIDSAIEYSSQRLELGDMDHLQALALLKKAASNAFGHQGCGLDWDRKPPGSPYSLKGVSYAEVYRGTSCSCRAEIDYRAAKITGLAIDSAC